MFNKSSTLTGAFFINRVEKLVKNANKNTSREADEKREVYIAEKLFKNAERTKVKLYGREHKRNSNRSN